MNIYTVMLDSPYLSVLSIYIIVQGIVSLINRIGRHININKHGYPPEHCDADGDFRDDKNFLDEVLEKTKQ